MPVLQDTKSTGVASSGKFLHGSDVVQQRMIKSVGCRLTYMKWTVVIGQNKPIKI